jgi:hypothetical protein
VPVGLGVVVAFVRALAASVGEDFGSLCAGQ